VGRNVTKLVVWAGYSPQSHRSRTLLLLERRRVWKNPNWTQNCLPVGMPDGKRAGSPLREHEQHLVLLLPRLAVLSPLRGGTANQLGKMIAWRGKEDGPFPLPLGLHSLNISRPVTHTSRLLRRILTLRIVPGAHPGKNQSPRQTLCR
jgi:hypothetical protein